MLNSFPARKDSSAVLKISLRHSHDRSLNHAFKIAVTNDVMQRADTVSTKEQFFGEKVSARELCISTFETDEKALKCTVEIERMTRNTALDASKKFSQGHLLTGNVRIPIALTPQPLEFYDHSTDCIKLNHNGYNSSYSKTVNNISGVSFADQ